MTVRVKACIVCTIIKFNFIVAVYRHTQYLSITSVSSVKWSAFLKGILLTLQSHDWNNGTNGGHNWWSRPGFAPTDSVSHSSGIGHCVGIVAAHGVS